MSLLAGIRFIPKHERVVDSDSGSDQSKNSIDKKERKKSKKRKQKHQSKEKKAKKKRHESSSEENDSENEAKAEKKQQYNWKADRDQHADDKNDEVLFQDFLREEQDRIISSAPSQTRINRWKAGYDFSDNEPDEFNQVVLKEEEKKAIITQESNFNRSPSPREEKSSTITNKNIAALLRSKLKATTKALDPDIVLDIRDKQLSSENIESVGNNDLLQSVQLTKEFQLLKHQYRSLQSQKVTSEEDLARVAKQQKASKNALSAMSSAYDADNIDQIYASNIMRLKGNYKGTELLSRQNDGSGFTEEDSIDMSLFQRGGKAKGGDSRGKGTTGKDTAASEQTALLKSQIQASMKEQNKLLQVLKSCQWCVSNPSFPSSLLIGQSDHLLIRVKSHQYSLVKGHLEIIPRDHISSLRQGSEEMKKELLRTISSIQRMYERLLNKSTVVFEVAVRLSQRPHAVVDILPVDAGMENDVQMFFREAFLTCDEEWSQHKKVIELTEKKTLDTAVPPHFPYLYVSWVPISSTHSASAVSGYVHPIENDGAIKHSFCYDVMAGILEEDIYRMRKGRPYSQQKEKEDVLEWRHHWKEFDWMQYLQEE